VLATHLDHRPAERERLASAEAINALAAAADGPGILAGDLNAVPESETLRLLSAEWTKPHAHALPTIPVAAPMRQIDYVLARPGARWKAIEVRVLDEAVASDHRALLAVLELSPAAADREE
jgi:endonuclease/exonuclease/phosphatase family metal-dependent hydrolase